MTFFLKKELRLTRTKLTIVCCLTIKIQAVYHQNILRKNIANVEFRWCKRNMKVINAQL